MRLGAHVSIAKGFEGMAREASRLNLEAVQVFSRSPRGGKPREISSQEAEAAQAILKEAGVRPLIIHTPYLVNLAAEDPGKRGYSQEVTALDLARADLLGASLVVVHVGRYESSLEEGLRIIAQSLDAVMDAAGSRAQLCLENTAGQGREAGYRFSHIGRVMELAARGSELRVCLDTCHAFAAGYEVSSHEGWEALLEEFDLEVGLDRLSCIHCNDCAGSRGSRVDRHRHIGEGKIGLEGFGAMLKRPELQGLPCILETPVKTMDDYRKDLDVLGRLRKRA
ncbi:MAG: deoxyribonuclease IV [Bacillota bacterium]